MELDEQEDDAVFDWFYDGLQPLKYTKFVNGPSYRRYASACLCCRELNLIIQFLFQVAADAPHHGDPAPPGKHSAVGPD